MAEKHKIYPIPSWSEYRDPADGMLVYDWPYTAKCPRCGQETMAKNKCTNPDCDFDGRGERCPSCEKPWHWEYFIGGKLCPDCEKKREWERREQALEERVEALKKDPSAAFEDVRKLSKRDYNAILANWLRGDWRDEIAYEWVGQLLKEIWRLRQK